MTREPGRKPKPSQWELRLYIAGRTQKCMTAFSNLKRICDEHLEGKYRIEVVDLLKNPQLARGDQILAVPPWCANCRSPCARSLVTFQIQNVCWWGWMSGRSGAKEYER
jgi:circadian clock protein KaiB